MTLYLVDYDIDVRVRHNFYRRLRRLVTKRIYSITNKQLTLREAEAELRERGIYFKSTLSVIVTNDARLAWGIYRLANRYGTANIYRCERIDVTPVAHLLERPIRYDTQEEQLLQESLIFIRNIEGGRSG